MTKPSVLRQMLCPSFASVNSSLINISCRLVWTYKKMVATRQRCFPNSPFYALLHMYKSKIKVCLERAYLAVSLEWKDIFKSKMCFDV